MTHHAHALAPDFPAPYRPLRLGLLTPHNPFDPRAFSGTVFHATRALISHPAIDLRVLGGHRPPGIADRIVRRRAGRSLPALQRSDFDGLDAAIGLVASDLLDELPRDLPFLHVTDATPAHLAETYGWDIPDSTHAREARIVGRAAACLYSSDMMAKRARAELGPLNAMSVPFGINMSCAPSQLPVKAPIRRLELIFVGADWSRKGGDIAVGALERLRARGIDAHLTLVGRIPEHLKHHAGITVAGYLDKSRPRHARRLSDLYARAHLLILPTRGDCTPMVIAEAMAHGTPVLATDTGAIAEMIRPGTGRSLSRSARAEDWADAIARVSADPEAYALMSDAAFDEARSRFSWVAWADRVADIAAKELARPASAA